MSFILVACNTEIEPAPINIEIIHPNTLDFYKVDEYHEKQYKDDKVDGILFVPKVGWNNNPDGFNSYYLYFTIIKPIDNNQNVTINSLKLEGINDVQLELISKEINQKVEFEKSGDPKLVATGYMLIEEFFKYFGGKIGTTSKLRLIVNVTIEENGKSYNKDLVFDLATRERKTWSFPYKVDESESN